jgi:hypothetical protein
MENFSIRVVAEFAAANADLNSQAFGTIASTTLDSAVATGVSPAKVIETQPIRVLLR